MEIRLAASEERIAKTPATCFHPLLETILKWQRPYAPIWRCSRLTQAARKRKVAASLNNVLSFQEIATKPKLTNWESRLGQVIPCPRPWTIKQKVSQSRIEKWRQQAVILDLATKIKYCLSQSRRPLRVSDPIHLKIRMDGQRPVQCDSLRIVILARRNSHKL